MKIFYDIRTYHGRSTLRVYKIHSNRYTRRAFARLSERRRTEVSHQVVDISLKKGMTRNVITELVGLIGDQSVPMRDLNAPLNLEVRQTTIDRISSLLG